MSRSTTNKFMRGTQSHLAQQAGKMRLVPCAEKDCDKNVLVDTYFEYWWLNKCATHS